MYRLRSLPRVGMKGEEIDISNKYVPFLTTVFVKEEYKHYQIQLLTTPIQTNTIKLCKHVNVPT